MKFVIGCYAVFGYLDKRLASDTNSAFPSENLDFGKKSFLYDPRIKLKCFFPSNQGASPLGPGFYAGTSVKTGIIL